MSTPRVNVTLWVLFTILAVGYLSIGYITAFLALSAKNWPVVAGEIVSSTVGEGCGRGTGPRPEVHYKYSYEGRQYQSEQIAIDTKFCGFFGSDTDIVNKYQPGQAVSVFVNPDKPYQATLLAGSIQPITFRNFLFAALVLAFSTYRLVSAWRGRSHKSSHLPGAA